MRRALLPILVLLLLAPSAALAQPEGPVATLTLDVQPDRTATMTPVFEGLRRLTRYEGLCLPEGARETRVHDELGDVPYDARGTSVTIDMARGAPGDHDHPLYAANVNFCVPAQSRVVVRVNVPERHTLFFMGGASTLAARSGTAATDGPTHVFYAYEAPLDPQRGMTALDASPFRVFVAQEHAAQAQEVASLAVAPLRAALAEAGLPVPFDALRVLYAPQTPFAWEAGHYNGHGFVQVKDETLTGGPSDGYPLSAVRVLVHEAFHAASFPYGRGPVEDAVAWWLEGTAKRAERHVDAALPNMTRHCERSVAEVRCWDFDDRIRRVDLETGYGSSFAFDADWEPSLPQHDDTRRFYYAYSEFVVSAWIARHGEAEYQRVWDDITAAFETGEGCPCAHGWLERRLDDPDLFRPWQDVKASMPQEFEALVKPYVKDEEALQRELARQANPLPLPGVPLALTALAIAALRAWPRRR